MLRVQERQDPGETSVYRESMVLQETLELPVQRGLRATADGPAETVLLVKQAPRVYQETRGLRGNAALLDPLEPVVSPVSMAQLEVSGYAVTQESMEYRGRRVRPV